MNAYIVSGEILTKCDCCFCRGHAQQVGRTIVAIDEEQARSIMEGWINDREGHDWEWGDTEPYINLQGEDVLMHAIGAPELPLE